MTFLAGLLLAVATLITLLVVELVTTAHPVGGADAMGLVVVFAVLGARWVAVAGAVLIAAQRGALWWLHRSRAVQAGAALLWVALLGVASLTAVVLAYGPRSEQIVPWAFTLAVAVPAIVIAGTAISLWGQSERGRAALPWRLAAGIVTLVGAAGAAFMFQLEYQAELRGRAVAAAEERERAQWDAARQRAFEALPATAPLRAWLPWLQASDELGARAIAAIRARPTLEQDVAAMLHGDEAPAALRFMWLWMPDPPASLAKPARDAIATLPDWADGWLARPPEPPPTPVGARDPIPVANPVDLHDMAQAAIVIADGYASTGLDFETPVTAFASVLERHALPEDQLGQDPTYQPRAYLRTWLDGRSVRRRGGS